MALLQDGVRSLGRNLPVFGLALVVFSLLIGCDVYVGDLLESLVDINDPPVWFGIAKIAQTILYSGSISLANAVVFAMLGRAIDRPAWKCDVPGEAVRRFFVLWFILTLVGEVLNSFFLKLESDDAKLSAFFLLMIFQTAIVPLGACVMFRGALVWEELGETLDVVPRQGASFVLVFLVGILQLILLIAFGLAFPPEKGQLVYNAIRVALSSMPLCGLDLLAFCMAWRICMLDRDTAHQRGGFPED